MKLDARTIVFLIIIGTLLTGIGLHVVARGYLGQVRGVAQWAKATLLQSAGWIIFGALRGVLPDVVSIVLGNVLMLSALCWYFKILADFTETKQSTEILYLLIASEALLLFYFSAIQQDLYIRSLVIALYVAILTLKSSHILLFSSLRTSIPVISRVPDAAKKLFGIDLKSRPASHTFTAAMFALCGVIMLFRLVYLSTHSPVAGAGAFDMNTLNDVTFMATFIFSVMVTFGFLLMCNDAYFIQQKIAEQALQASEQRLRRLMNSSLIGIFQCDAAGDLKEANQVFLSMLGCSALAEKSLNWWQMTGPQSHLQQRKKLLDLLSDPVLPPFETQILSDSGVPIPIMLGMALLEGSEQEWVGFVVDLRAQKKVDLLQSEFISIVSHELRTPLTSIRGSLGLLEAGVAGTVPPKALQLIQIAHKNSQRLVSLVNDILDMERLTSGKMVMHMQALDLSVLTRQAIEANAGYAENFKTRYVLEPLEPALTQAMVLADADRLMQVFANLLSNAAKFSPADEPVLLRLLKHEANYRIEIEDHGSGIPEAFRERIFGRFAQADGTATRQLEGAGLGLNISKAMINKMQGSIGFSSIENLATIFWFELPALPSNHTLCATADLSTASDPA